MARKRKITIEAKSVDEAWYPCSLKFEGKQVIVHFLGYGSDADESWDLDGFSTREEVLNRVRVTSEQLQDKECAKVSVSMTVCALKETKKEKKYFDAVVMQITKRKHTKKANGHEECKCKFRLLWKGGPGLGKVEEVECSAITTLCNRDPEKHPQLKLFMEMVGSRKSAPNTRKKRKGSTTLNSVRKKRKAGLKEVQPEDLVTGEETPTTHILTEREICSTINEVCDAYQPNKSDADVIQPVKGVKVEGGKDKKAGKLWSTTKHKDKHKDSLLKDPRSINLEAGQSSESDKTESSTSGNKLTSDHDSSKRKSNRGATGQQNAARNISSSDLEGPQGQGPGHVADLNGHATPTSADMPEKGATTAHEVILISDDEQESPKVSNLHASKSFPQMQLVQTSEEREQICSGLWPISCALRIDNVEKDLCPQLARTFLSGRMENLISVFLFPAGENETSSFGFLIFKDSQAAENALKLVTNKYIVASHHQRPWSVKQAKDSIEERALLTLLARGNWHPSPKDIEPSVSTSRVSSQQNAQLTWILPEMKEYKVVKELLELHSAHRKRLQALWKTFNREEARKKLQTIG